MRAFVTGATGFVGGAAARALARAGWEVLALARDPARARDLERSGIEPVAGDLDAPERWLPAARACEAFVHCAAEYGPRYLALDRSAATAALAGLAAERARRVFLYTSGVWVLGDTRGATRDESAPPDPAPLVAARAETERAVLAASGGALRALVLRPGCAYGGHGSLTARWFETAEREGAARVVGDGANRWSMVHVDDVADLYVRAAESDLGGRVLHGVDGRPVSMRACAEAASRAAGAGGAVRNETLAAARAQLGPVADCLVLDQLVDARETMRALGWRPRQPSFVDGAARWHRAWKAHARG